MTEPLPDVSTPPRSRDGRPALRRPVLRRLRMRTRADLPATAIILADLRKLRRAGVACFLKPWSASIGALVTTFDLGGTLPDPVRSAPRRVLVICVGGRSIAGADTWAWIKSVCDQLPDTPFIVLSDQEDAEEVVAAFRAGARGFIPTSLEPAVALQALAFILAGGTFFPPAVLLDPDRGPGGEVDRSLDLAGDLGKTVRSVGPEPACGTGLTARQQEVLRLLRQGKSNKLIGRDLNMCESTVKVHVRQIMRKLGAVNRTQAALCAVGGYDCPPPFAQVTAGQMA